MDVILGFLLMSFKSSPDSSSHYYRELQAGQPMAVLYHLKEEKAEAEENWQVFLCKGSWAGSHIWGIASAPKIQKEMVKIQELQITEHYSTPAC